MRVTGRAITQHIAREANALGREVRNIHWDAIASDVGHTEAEQAWPALQQARVSVEKLLRKLLTEHSRESKEQCRMYKKLFKETKKPR
jgi:hypothetical protein